MADHRRGRGCGRGCCEWYPIRLLLSFPSVLSFRLGCRIRVLSTPRLFCLPTGIATFCLLACDRARESSQLQCESLSCQPMVPMSGHAIYHRLPYLSPAGHTHAPGQCCLVPRTLFPNVYALRTVRSLSVARHGSFATREAVVLRSTRRRPASSLPGWSCRGAGSDRRIPDGRHLRLLRLAVEWS